MQSLTSWGMKEVSSDPTVMKGGVLHRLFHRAFPGYFRDNSIHLWQPFYTPAMNLILAQEQGYLSSIDVSMVKRVDAEGKNGKPITNTMDFKKDTYKNLAHRIVSFEKSEWSYKPNRAQLPLAPIEISSYDEIKKILGPQVSLFPNNAVANPELITNSALRTMWTGTDKSFLRAQGKLASMITKDKQTVFKEYFDKLSDEIIAREQRTFQNLPRTAEKIKIELNGLEELKKTAKNPSLPEDIYQNEKKRLMTKVKDLKEGQTDQVYQLDVVKE